MIKSILKQINNRGIPLKKSHLQAVSDKCTLDYMTALATLWDWGYTSSASVFDETDFKANLIEVYPEETIKIFRDCTGRVDLTLYLTENYLGGTIHNETDAESFDSVLYQFYKIKKSVQTLNTITKLLEFSKFGVRTDMSKDNPYYILLKNGDIKAVKNDCYMNDSIHDLVYKEHGYLYRVFSLDEHIVPADNWEYVSISEHKVQIRYKCELNVEKEERHKHICIGVYLLDGNSVLPDRYRFQGYCGELIKESDLKLRRLVPLGLPIKLGGTLYYPLFRVKTMKGTIPLPVIKSQSEFTTYNKKELSQKLGYDSWSDLFRAVLDSTKNTLAARMVLMALNLETGDSLSYNVPQVLGEKAYSDSEITSASIEAESIFKTITKGLI